mgnify:CR=1 FL=1|jgi:hypothetical protein
MVHRIDCEMMFNIGDEINYKNVFDEASRGTILSVSSDMDSYEVMELKDGVPYYASKKLTAAENKRRKAAKKSALSTPVFAPVKPKNMKSVFIEVLSINTPKGWPDYVPIGDVVV